MVRTFKERFLRFQLLFPDFYPFHHVIWGMKWAKKLKLKMDNISSRPFSHDAAHIATGMYVIYTIYYVANNLSFHILHIDLRRRTTQSRAEVPL